MKLTALALADGNRVLAKDGRAMPWDEWSREFQLHVLKKVVDVYELGVEDLAKEVTIFLEAGLVEVTGRLAGVTEVIALAHSRLRFITANPGSELLQKYNAAVGLRNVNKEDVHSVHLELLESEWPEVVEQHLMAPAERDEEGNAAFEDFMRRTLPSLSEETENVTVNRMWLRGLFLEGVNVGRLL